MNLKERDIPFLEFAVQRGLTGHYTPISMVGEPCRAFVPAPLPPDPPLEMSAGSALRIHEHLQRSPIMSAAQAAAVTGLFQMTCGATLQKLQSTGLVREITGNKYGRLYCYEAYLAILGEGTEPLRR